MNRPTHWQCLFGCVASLALTLGGCSRLLDLERYRFAGDGLDAGSDLGVTDGGGVLGDLSPLDLSGADLAGGVLTPSNGITCDHFGPDLTLDGAIVIDTDTASISRKTGGVLAMGVTIGGDIALFCASTIQIPTGADVVVKGTSRLAFVVASGFYLNGSLDLSGQPGLSGVSAGLGGKPGPGGGGGGGSDQTADSAIPGGGGGSPGVDQINVVVPATGSVRAGGGGYGGGSRLAGAAGGSDLSTAVVPGGTPNPTGTAGQPQFGGGGGGGGGSGASRGGGGGGGGGGGAFQVSALGGTGLIEIGEAARLDVSGGGGGGGQGFPTLAPNSGPSLSGGGGGGGGGMIWLEAATVNLPVMASACISAVGGGGGNGAVLFGSSFDGDAAQRSAACPYTSSAPPTELQGSGRGGRGLVPSQGQDGLLSPSASAAGGGGGGSPGYVYVRSSNAVTTLRVFPLTTSVLLP